MNFKSCLLLAATGLVVCLSGCAPKVLEAPPVAWPEIWRGRKLFNTPRAYIYAGSPALAGYADRAAEEVGKDFENASGRSAPKGLLVMTDSKDEPVFEDVKVFFMAAMRADKRRERANKQAASQPAASAPESRPDGESPVDEDAELEAQWLAFSQTKQKTGMDMMAMIEIAPLPLNESQIVDLIGMSSEVANQAGWAVLLPSEPMVRRGVHKLTSGMLKNPELGVAAKIAAAPLLLAMEPKMVSMMLVTHKAVLFEQMARQQPDWTPEQVSKLAKAYSDGQLKPVMEDMMADAKARIPQPPASQPTSGPANQPATAPETAQD
jgi:hypothetical protein